MGAISPKGAISFLIRMRRCKRCIDFVGAGVHLLLQTQKVYLFPTRRGTPFASNPKGVSIPRPPGYTFRPRPKRCIYFIGDGAHLLPETQKVYLFPTRRGTPFASNPKGVSIPRPPGYAFCFIRKRCIDSLAAEVHLLHETQKVYQLLLQAGTPFAPDPRGASILSAPGYTFWALSKRWRGSVVGGKRRLKLEVLMTRRSRHQRIAKNSSEEILYSFLTLTLRHSLSSQSELIG